MTRPSDAGYLAFDGRPFRLRMGTRPLDLDRWLEVDEARDRELALKAELMEERPDEVVVALDDEAAAAASSELEAEIRSWLLGHGVQLPSADPSLHPIARCGLLAQEDWCVLVAGHGPGLVLGAASVCFPTRWRVAEKLGRSTADIHAPVAFYDEQLAAPVDALIDRLRVDEPKWRINWNLVDDESLFQPERRPGPPIAPDEVPDRIWLRVERQTLRRLRVTGAVAFSIRVLQQPLSTLAGDAEVLGRLRAAVDAMPEPTFAYKGLAPFADSLRTWIDSVRTA